MSKPRENSKQKYAGPYSFDGHNIYGYHPNREKHPEPMLIAQVTWMAGTYNDEAEATAKFIVDAMNTADMIQIQLNEEMKQEECASRGLAHDEEEIIQFRSDISFPIMPKCGKG